MDTKRLEHINATPAQTWNWLSMNDTSLEVPNFNEQNVCEKASCESCAEPKQTGRHTAEPLSDDTDDTGDTGDTTQGRDALGIWIARHASAHNVFRVHRGTDSNIYTVLLDTKNPLQTTNIEVEEGASATLCVAALGRGTSAGFTAHKLSITLKKGARLYLHHLIALSDADTHAEAIEVHLADEAALFPQQYFLGAKKTIFGLKADVAGAGAGFKGKARYTIDTAQTLDLTYTLLQKGTNTKTSLDAAGVLGDGAKKTLRATIDLQKGCKGASGKEQETVILAGKHVVNKTLPVILCAEDDVEGNHGATIGSLSPEMLFYLASRGVTQEAASDLMKEAIIDDARTQLPDELSKAVAAWAQWSQGSNERAQDANNEYFH